MNDLHLKTDNVHKMCSLYCTVIYLENTKLTLSTISHCKQYVSRIMDGIWITGGAYET